MHPFTIKVTHQVIDQPLSVAVRVMNRLAGKSMKKKVCRQTAYARQVKERLIAQLGGVCVRCGTAHELEFDHINGRDWEPRKLSSSARLAKYRREAEAGLLQLLCSPCNKAVRETNDNGAWVATGTNAPKTVDMPF